MEFVPKGFVVAMEVQSTLLEKICEAQKNDKEIAEIKSPKGVSMTYTPRKPGANATLTFGASSGRRRKTKS